MPICSGKDTSGKFTEERVEPLSEYFTNLPATSKPMFSWASAVEPPICGVKITLSNLRSGETNSSLIDAGSTGNTSTAAPRTLPCSSAAAKASISTTVPRAALIKIESCFNCAIRSALIKLRVEGKSGT